MNPKIKFQLISPLHTNITMKHTSIVFNKRPEEQNCTNMMIDMKF